MSQLGISVGLVPESHTCKYHNRKMKAVKQERQKVMRTIYQCPVKGCHFVGISFDPTFIGENNRKNLKRDWMDRP